jgi:hypothetical protein
MEEAEKIYHDQKELEKAKPAYKVSKRQIFCGQQGGD